LNRIKIFQVSAFANGPFTGNPAAVCPLDKWLPDAVMQGIAAENNLSETAFFVSRDDGAYDLRWFTPTVEVDLCGHATLASGHVVLNVLSTDSEQVTFHTRSGELHVSRQDDLLALDLPAKLAAEQHDQRGIAALEQVLGVRPVAVLDAGLSVAIFEQESQVSELTPDFSSMLTSGLNWVSVTAPSSESETDFVSRYFAPGSGIDEDPVTGSAHGWLVPYWSKRLNKSSLKTRQVSKRGGWLWCEDRGDRVSVAGSVVDYLTGEIILD
jgi:PhzF family phenazine biosynthesis protein